MTVVIVWPSFPSWLAAGKKWSDWPVRAAFSVLSSTYGLYCCWGEEAVSYLTAKDWLLLTCNKIPLLSQGGELDRNNPLHWEFFPSFWVVLEFSGITERNLMQSPCGCVARQEDCSIHKQTSFTFILGRTHVCRRMQTWCWTGFKVELYFHLSWKP